MTRERRNVASLLERYSNTHDRLQVQRALRSEGMRLIEGFGVIAGAWR